MAGANYKGKVGDLREKNTVSQVVRLRNA